jgi:hypothetical protein
MDCRYYVFWHKMIAWDITTTEDNIYCMFTEKQGQYSQYSN